MTEVLFYILEDSRPGARENLARRIARKAWQQGHRVYLHAPDADRARALDQRFWEQPREDFLPHALAGSEEAADTAILIGHGEDPGGQRDVLINLDRTVPEFCDRFQRVAELVAGDENERREARLRWKFYRERNYPVQDHRLRG